MIKIPWFLILVRGGIFNNENDKEKLIKNKPKEFSITYGRHKKLVLSLKGKECDDEEAPQDN